jgi:hypothetical protein
MSGKTIGPGHRSTPGPTMHDIEHVIAPGRAVLAQGVVWSSVDVLSDVDNS